MTNAEIIAGLREIKNILKIGNSPNSVINGAINALERKEGTWIDDGISDLYVCSLCHSVHTFNHKFCPDCGARMEAKDED